MIAKRIIEGGSGKWGDIPMTPHPDLNPEDARKMAIYVLSLDGEKKK
jgi:cytochrome c